MAENTPWNHMVPMVDPETGIATPEFMRWMQENDNSLTEVDTDLEAVANDVTDLTNRNIDTPLAGGLEGGGDLSADRSLSLQEQSAVVPGEYGDAATIPVITVNDKGIVTDIDEVAASGGGGGGLALDDFMTGTKWVVLPHVGNNTLTTIGVGVTSSGTSGANWANTNEFTKRRRVNLLCAAAINSVRTVNTVEAMPCGIGNGWRWRGRFGVVADVATSKTMFGFCSNTALGAGVEPSALTAAVLCIGKDTTDNNFQIIHNDAAGGACTKIDLGASFPARTNNADIYDVEFWSDLGDADISYKVTNIVSGVQATGSIAANCPAAGTGVTDQGLKIGNATTAISYQVAFFGMMYEQAYANDTVP